MRHAPLRHAPLHPARLSPADRWQRRTGAALVATALVLGAAACSGDGEPSGEPGGEPTSAASSASPGPEVAADTASFEAPSGFVLADPSKKSEAVIATGTAGNLVSLVELDFPGEAPSLERQAEIAATGLGEKFTVEEPVEVDGVEMWHLSGKEAKGRFVDVYGAVVDETAVRLTLRLANEEYDTEQRAAVNQQLLDSWTWAS